MKGAGQVFGYVARVDLARELAQRERRGQENCKDYVRLSYQEWELLKTMPAALRDRLMPGVRG